VLEVEVDLEDSEVEDFKPRIFLIYFLRFLEEVFHEERADKHVESNAEKISSMICT
jgi:hypothetical protein